MSTRKAKNIATIECMLIAEANGYSPKIIAQCALRVYFTTDKQIWYDISQCILDIKKSWM